MTSVLENIPRKRKLGIKPMVTVARGWWAVVVVRMFRGGNLKFNNTGCCDEGVIFVLFSSRAGSQEFIVRGGEQDVRVLFSRQVVTGVGGFEHVAKVGQRVAAPWRPRKRNARMLTDSVFPSGGSVFTE